MTLRLTVLGGGAAWPNPGQGCSSYLVTSESTRLLLDCGPDTLHELRRQVDFRTIDAVVISHCHADHMLDLVAYRYGLKYGYARPERRIPLWLPPGGIERLAMLGSALAFGSEGSDGGEAFWSGVFDLHEYDPSTVLDIDDIQVAFVSTQHFVPCYAMRVSGPDGRSLAYTADTGAIADLIAPFTGVSTVLAEGTERDHADRPTEDRGHLTPFDAGELARETSASRLIITHLWSERDDDEVIEDAARAYRGEIIVAKPGMSLDV